MADIPDVRVAGQIGPMVFENVIAEWLNLALENSVKSGALES